MAVRRPRVGADDREMLRLAVPAFAALVSEPLFLLADTAVVGHLGTTPLAALAVAAVVVQTLVGLCVFLAYGTTATVGRRLGAGDLRGALTDGVAGSWLALGIGVVLAVGLGTGVVLAALAVVFIAPFVWMVSASLQDVSDMFRWPPQWIPRSPDLGNFALFFQQANIGRLFFNSAYVAIAVTLIQLFTEKALQKDLTLAEMAGVAHMSPYHFSRLFKESTGLTPHRYVIERRVQRAEVLLGSSALPIAEIALLCDFANQGHLNRHFKRLLGVSPKAFR